MINTTSQSDKNFSALLSAIPDRVFVISSEGVFLDVFGGSDTNVVYSSSKVLGMSFNDLFPKATSTKFQKVVLKTIETQSTQQFIYHFDPENFPPLPDGIRPTTTQWYESRVHPLPEEYKNKNAVIWVVRNITDSEELKRKLKRHATIDDLTGVMNRRSFLDSAERALSSMNRFREQASLLMLDIDNFKSVNDMYGHHVGDQVIRGVAYILIDHVRDIDIIGRLGGEEFSIILPHTDEKEASHVADRICTEVRNTCFEDTSPPLNTTISIGVTEIQNSDDEIKHVLKRADKALYFAKNTSKDKFVLYSDLQITAREFKV